MRKYFENWEWEDTWISLIFAAVGVVIVFVLMALFADHNVRYYYLQGSSTNTELIIKGDIDWADDVTLQLDRGISYTEAIEMIERLNKTLNNK